MKYIDNKDKKQRILNAALTLFSNTHDVKKVSIEAIAKQANVSPTTIYNNFGTREKLVYEVIKLLFEDNIERNRVLFYSDVPFPQKIMGVISGKMDMTSSLNSEILDKIISQDESISPYIDEVYINEIRPLWLKMLDDGKKEGYIDESLNNEALLIYLDTIKAGTFANKEIWKNYLDKIELMQQITRIMFYGFLKKEIDLFNKGGK
ncbi:MAG: TetR/AcrR family transcriptional regulator [Dehalococcoidales bacterium]|nr:TetR/AcrR family transcriptional regulator [Dehalococcoidales bacterium]